MVLETTFRTSTGTVVVTDASRVGPGDVPAVHRHGRRYRLIDR